jgi:hypothetical protein
VPLSLIGFWRTVMVKNVFKTGAFAGVDVNDAFAVAALQQSPIVVDVAKQITWPDQLGPVVQKLGDYRPGTTITGAVSAQVDVLILLYTELETSALLDVFTGDNAWSPARKKSWYPYGHNFVAFKSTIQGIDGDDALKDGIFGYLYALQVGKTNVVLYKSELHPKGNGDGLPFVPLIEQLVRELAPKLVISTGTAGGIGSVVQCGDVAICSAARFHVQSQYPKFPAIDTMSQKQQELTSAALGNGTYLGYAQQNFTKLSLPGLAQCYSRLEGQSGYSFVKKNMDAPKIYTAAAPVSGPEPMVVVSADYLTVDDDHDSEGLQALGIMNETDDAFAFYAISLLDAATRPNWLSVRNASEPQIVAQPFPPNTPPTEIVDELKGIAGTIYGIYQYCTTLNSAFACWAIAADLNS